MANLSKKWGAVIGCWCVALVLVVTGICLALTIPSSAADDAYEGDIAVTFDGETTVYHTVQEAFEVANACVTTADEPVTIQLRSNVTSEGLTIGMTKNYIFDLNGYVCSISSILQLVNYDNMVELIDSRPDSVHNFAYVGNNKYEYTDGDKPGFDIRLNGGVMVCTSDWPSMMVSSVENSDNSQMVLNGGTYLGSMFFGMVGTEQNKAEVVIKQGVNVHCGVNLNNVWQLADPIDGEMSFMSQGNSQFKIDGGNIYGEIIAAEFDDEGSMMLAAEAIDLTSDNLPEWIHVDEGIVIKTQQDAAGNYFYQTVNTTTDQPTTTPTEPITEQTANNNNNMLGIIVLGAATVVMIAGVGTAIGMVAKRRQRKAA